MAEHPCYRCGPELNQYRYLCPRCRSLYTLTAAGRMAVRKTGDVGVFELKGTLTFGQFVLGGKQQESN